MTEDKDYYSILGVSRNADTFEIDMAYRKLFKKFHPDENQGDPFMTKHFDNINEAYKELSKLSRERDELRASGHSGARMNYGLDEMMSGQTPEVRNIIKDLNDYLDKEKLATDAYLKIEVAKHSESIGYGIVFRILAGLAIMYGTWAYFNQSQLFRFTQNDFSSFWKAKEEVTIYSEPDIQSPEIGKIDLNGTFSSVSETKYFIKIEFANADGGVSEGYILKSKVKRE